MDINKVFENFCAQLQNRTRYTSEDTIRYYWMLSMLACDNTRALNQYVLEMPYDKNEVVFEQNSKNAKKELDLLYVSAQEQWAIEIKFHRKSPDSSYVHTDAAGSIFNDIFRLQYAPLDNKIRGLVKRLLLYVTDSEMNDYFSEEAVNKAWQNKTFRNELHKFYSMDINQIARFNFIKENLNKEDKNDQIPETFTDKAFDSFKKEIKQRYFTSPPIRLLCKKDDLKTKSTSFKGQMFCVRLYEVMTSY